MGLDFIIKIGGKEYYMDCPLSNFMLLLKAAMTWSSTPYLSVCETPTVKDTSNANCSTTYPYYSSGNYYGYNYVYGQAAAGNDNYGILVGSNNTAVVITDYALNTKIAHGNGAGQLAYGTTVLTYGGSGANKWAKIARTFTNNTANPIDVKEVGYATKDQGSKYVMITRDVIATYTIPAADTLPVEVYIRTTA